MEEYGLVWFGFLLFCIGGLFVCLLVGFVLVLDFLWDFGLLRRKAAYVCSETGVATNQVINILMLLPVFLKFARVGAVSLSISIGKQLMHE